MRCATSYGNVTGSEFEVMAFWIKHPVRPIVERLGLIDRNHDDDFSSVRNNHESDDHFHVLAEHMKNQTLIVADGVDYHHVHRGSEFVNFPISH